MLFVRLMQQMVGRSAVVALAALTCRSAHAQSAQFWALGDLPGNQFHSVASDVSSDGGVVVGYASSYPGLLGEQAFRWTSKQGMVGLGDLPGGEPLSEAFGVSPDGHYVVGASSSISGRSEAFMWSQSQGMRPLGNLPGKKYTTAFDVSNAGAVVVGSSRNGNTTNEAFRWTPATGMTGLGFLPGGALLNSAATGLSRDGGVIAGWSTSSSGRQPFRWTQETGMVALADLPGGGSTMEAFGYAISDNGQWIVGDGRSDNGQEAALWRSDGSVVGLGALNPGRFFSHALGVSDDGRVVVGMSTIFGYHAFVWTPEWGMRSVSDVLTSYGVDMTGWYLGSAEAVSADGRFIVGQGRNPAGQAEAWMAFLPIPAPSAAAVLVLGLSLSIRRQRRP